MIDTNDIAEAFYRDLSRLLQEVDSFSNDGAIWRVLPGINNSVGNLVLHLEGNLREYIGREIGGVPFDRKRDLEFSTSDLTVAELHAKVEGVREIVSAVIGRLSANSFPEVQRLKLSGKQVSTFQYLVLLYGHLNYHLGQIDYLRRIGGNGSAISFVELPQ
jgi:hypothetical protein